MLEPFSQAWEIYPRNPSLVKPATRTDLHNLMGNLLLVENTSSLVRHIPRDRLLRKHQVHLCLRQIAKISGVITTLLEDDVLLKGLGKKKPPF